MTFWQLAGLWFGLMVYALAWLRGGHPERFGAAVLLFAGLLASPSNAWQVGGAYPGWAVLDGGMLVALGWLAFRSDRWWAMVAASSYGLMVFAQVIRLMDPTFSHYAMVSAHVGLGYVVDLALLGGVWERWLAGEPPAARAAWAAATAARQSPHPREIQAT